MTRLLAGTALALTLSLSTPAFAQEPLATVNGVAITQADVEAAREDIANAVPQQITPEEQDRFVLDFLIDAELIAQDGEAQGLNEGEAYEARLEQLEKRALMEEALAANLRATVTDEAVQSFYDEQVGAQPVQQEVRARHILVETEDEANAARARLDEGEAFETVADELTIDPSGKGRGGDLGFFTRGRMVPAFETAAFALEPGEVSEPVESQFGWHIIKTEEKRDVEPPALEAVEAQIREVLGRQAQTEYVQRLRTEGDVVRAGAEATDDAAGEAEPEAEAEPAETEDGTVLADDEASAEE